MKDYWTLEEIEDDIIMEHSDYEDWKEKIIMERLK